jgi:hypothetical protein
LRDSSSSVVVTTKRDNYLISGLPAIAMLTLAWTLRREQTFAFRDLCFRRLAALHAPHVHEAL